MSDGTKKDNRFPRKTRELIRIIKKADEEDRLYETVMEELQHPVSMPALWACREYIDQLRDEVCHQDGMESYLLLSISALIATMEDELEKAEQYLALLGETPAHIDAGQCNGKDYIRMATEIVMPYVSDNKFFHIAAALTDMKLPVKNLTLSASRPSILNGFRDFTRYGRKIAENRTALQKTIQTLYGDKSKGVINIALAEWYYQENDPFHALLLITGTIPFMENKRDIQCLFVAMALQMKILLLNGQIKAAMMHYAATPESDAELKPEGFLLVDSGGHYFEGTTDITRTMALGPITDEMRLHFTTVCRSNMNLAHAKFLYGCTGLNLDILSRGPLWEMGIDYKCGTGHGVGYVLNVHEGPNGFRWRVVPERHDNGVLEEGMITTDEPGVYLEGKYGIRTENELVCRKAEKNEYGQFMEFENITYAPIDLDAIDPDLLSAREKKMLNDYHKMVYDTISPYMTAEENEWLKRYTRAI